MTVITSRIDAGDNLRGTSVEESLQLRLDFAFIAYHGDVTGILDSLRI